ncbi:MAG: DUF3301 domain-containing protein [Piscirickettsiaceae bacterium]|nr:DUF3301 domain-containing protein [Piscirickettsiaceae bacterium]
MIDNGLAILVLFGLAWFWWDNRGVAERAIQAARRSCDQAGVTFLNDTVGWKKIRLKRNRHGRMNIERTYFFEFASDMQQRYTGEIIMLGQQVNRVSLEAYRITDI